MTLTSSSSSSSSKKETTAGRAPPVSKKKFGELGSEPLFGATLHYLLPSATNSIGLVTLPMRTSVSVATDFIPSNARFEGGWAFKHN